MQAVDILAIGAVVGGIIGMIGYIPQVTHLIKVKNSKGVSVVSWVSFLFGNFLLLVYAISISNISYIIVYALSCVADTAIIILTVKYKDNK